jgi:hypothetical protein
MAARIKSMLPFPAQMLPRGSYKRLMIQSLGRLNGGGREEPGSNLPRPIAGVATAMNTVQLYRNSTVARNPTIEQTSWRALGLAWSWSGSRAD